MLPCRRTQRKTLALQVAYLLLPLVTANCYFPNGTDRNIGLSYDLYQACNGGDKHSMCCQKDHDRCRSDGLCSNFQRNEIWRESCTDPTWQSPACVQLCVMGTDERNNEMVESDERVTACGDGTFCCGIGPGQISCCSQGNGVWLVDGITTMKTPPRATKHPAAHSTLPSSSSSSLKSSITTSILSRTSQPSSTTSIPTSPPYSTSSTHSFGVGPLVSVILGSVLLAFLLVSAGIYIFRRRRKRRLLYAKQEPSVGDSIVILDVDGSTPSAPTEMEMQWSVQEIDGRVRPPEWEPNARNELPGPKEGVVWVDRRRNAVMRMGF